MKKLCTPFYENFAMKFDIVKVFMIEYRIHSDTYHISTNICLITMLNRC